jgi:hypothetical protein
MFQIRVICKNVPQVWLIKWHFPKEKWKFVYLIKTTYTIEIQWFWLDNETNYTLSHGQCGIALHWFTIKFVHSHLDDAYANNSINIWCRLLIFFVWVGHEVEQFPIQNWPGAILAFTYIFTSVSLFTISFTRCSVTVEMFHRVLIAGRGIQWCACTPCSTRFQHTGRGHMP